MALNVTFSDFSKEYKKGWEKRTGKKVLNSFANTIEFMAAVQKAWNSKKVRQMGGASDEKNGEEPTKSVSFTERIGNMFGSSKNEDDKADKPDDEVKAEKSDDENKLEDDKPEGLDDEVKIDESDEVHEDVEHESETGHVSVEDRLKKLEDMMKSIGEMISSTLSTNSEDF